MAAKPIFVQAVDTNGTPYSGAKLNVYDAGTTTPRAIYTESGLGTASANPAIADANGVVVVWVNDAGGDIKVTLTNSAETVTPHNEDNVPIASLTCYPVITFQGDQSLLTTSSPTFAGLTLGNVSFAGVVTDPNADRLVFWDDSAGQVNFMTLGTGLAFNGTALELDGDLQDISGLTPTDGGVIIGDGTDFVVESGATLRTSIGVAIGSDVQAYDANLDVYAASPLTAAELGELQNIGSTTINSTQWGYVGGLDQALATTDSPTFATVTSTSSVIGGVTVSPSGAAIGQALGFPNSASTLEPYTPAGGGDILSTATEYATGDLYYIGDLLGSASARSIVSALPGSPSGKDVHILDTADGGFAANSIIAYVGGAWRERVPHEGEAIYVEATDRHYIFSTAKAAAYVFRLIDPNEATGSISAVTIGGINALSGAVNRSAYGSDDLFYAGVLSALSLAGYTFTRDGGQFTATATTAGAAGNALACSIIVTDIEAQPVTGETFGGEDAQWWPVKVNSDGWDNDRKPADDWYSRPTFLTPEMFVEGDIAYAGGGVSTDYSGATDFAAAFQAMREEILRLLELSEWPATTIEPGVFRAPPVAIALQPGKRYRTTEPVNLTDIQAPGAKFYGFGATIVGDHAEGSIVDFIGSRGWGIHGLRLESDNGSRPQSGFLIGRSDADTTCADMKFYDCHVDGWFSKAAVANFASEVSAWVGGRVFNWCGIGTEPLGSCNACWIDSVNRMDVTSMTLADSVSLTSEAVESITAANPPIVTITGHSFSNGDKVGVYNVSGMTEINYLEGTIANATTNTFEISGIDATSFTSYTSGGRVHDLVNASHITHVLTGAAFRQLAPSNYGGVRVDSTTDGNGSSVQGLSIKDCYVTNTGTGTTGVFPGVRVRGDTDDLQIECSVEQQQQGDSEYDLTHDVLFDTQDGDMACRGFSYRNHLSDGELAALDKTNDSNTLTLTSAEVRISRKRGEYSGAQGKLFGANAGNIVLSGEVCVGSDADLQDISVLSSFSGNFITAAALSGVTVTAGDDVTVYASDGRKVFGQVLTEDGTAAAPALGPYSNPDTGIFFSGDTVRIANAGVLSGFFNGSGQFLVNTSSPSAAGVAFTATGKSAFGAGIELRNNGDAASWSRLDLVNDQAPTGTDNDGISHYQDQNGVYSINNQSGSATVVRLQRQGSTLVSLNSSGDLDVTGNLDVTGAVEQGSSVRIDGSGGFRFEVYTAAEIADSSNAVNTTDKAQGKAVWDSTNNRIMVAAGSGAGGTWYVADGSSGVTPS